MTAKAALCKALLDGRTLNVKNCFTLIGLTNCSREVSRMVEQPFGVIVFRTHRAGVSRYGQTVTWTDFRLPKIKENEEGVQKMREYIESQMPEEDIKLKYSKHQDQPAKSKQPETQQNLFL